MGTKPRPEEATASEVSRLNVGPRGTTGFDVGAACAGPETGETGNWFIRPLVGPVDGKGEISPMLEVGPGLLTGEIRREGELVVDSARWLDPTGLLAIGIVLAP